MVKIIALITLLFFGCSQNGIKEQNPQDEIQPQEPSSPPIKFEDIPYTPSEQIIEIE